LPESRIVLSFFLQTIPGMEGGERKENDGGGEFKYDIFDIV
jgi:hypothetical protein